MASTRGAISWPRRRRPRNSSTDSPLEAARSGHGSNPALKTDAEAILAQLGLNASEAIRLFYKQVTLSGGLPFSVTIPNATTRKTLRDADRGKNLERHGSVDELFKKLGV